MNCASEVILATRYINNEDLTFLKFVNPPFQLRSDFPVRIYCSGDLARFNRDGDLEFLGRIDSQVKLRGYRIELSEIESQLKQQCNVRNAAVLVKKDDLKIQRLVAYVVLSDISVQVDEILLKNRLKEKLADYMIPSVFVFLPELPLLQSGKVDVKKLPEIADLQQVAGREIILPVNHTEKEIHSIWKEKFAPLEVSVNDDFFDLGGHSLLASLVVSEMRKTEISKAISVKDIYQYRNIRALADFLDHQNVQKKVQEEAIKTEPVPNSTYIKTSVLQGISIYLILLVSSIGIISPFAIQKLFPGHSHLQPYIFFFSAGDFNNCIFSIVFSHFKMDSHWKV